jgi:hypothetical protein
MPDLAQRRAVQPFGREPAQGGGEVLVTLAQAIVARQQPQQQLVRAQIERCEREPAFELLERFAIGGAFHEAFQQRDVQLAEAPALRGQPAGEFGTRVELEPIEQIAVEERQERAQLIDRRCVERRPRPRDRQGIDVDVGAVELDQLPARSHAPAVRRVHDPTELREAPAQLAARVIRHVPEELAELRTRDRIDGQSQVGEQRAHFPRGRQRDRAAAAAHVERTQHADFHAGYHGRVHGPVLRSSPERIHGHDHFHDECPDPGPRPRSDQGAPAGRLVIRRLQRRRRNAADRRRVPVRGARPALDRHRPRRRRGERQRRARRRAPVVHGDRHRLCPGAPRARTGADGLAIEFREADAEALPFADEQFNIVVSTFGVMFTPDQQKAAAELLRVCKRGGKIGLANWTPAGYIGQLFGVIGKHIPPPAGVRSPAQWGTSERLAELFDAKSATVDATPRHFTFRYRSPDHMLETFKTFYGPMLKAFAALPPDGQAALKADLLALMARFNRAGDGTVVIPSEYLEVVITRR